MGGYLMSRATAQFGVFHPATGADAFPNALSFTPDKFLLVSSYQPPTKLFLDGKVAELVIAGEPVQVAPCRTDVTDSVAFYFPERRLMVTNFLVIDTIFNIYTLRGGAFRNPELLIGDARWVESKNAEILLDIHGPTLRGRDVVVEALERSVDSIQLIHDQTLRYMNRGWRPAEIAEVIDLPPGLAERWSARGYYGTLRHNAKAVYQKYLGWYDANPANLDPLPPVAYAKKTVEYMGGADAVIARAREDFRKGEFRWVASAMNQVVYADPSNRVARELGADALEQQGYQSEAGTWRSAYLVGAMELRNGVPKIPGGSSANADTLKAV
eukprot:gene48176-64643_t